MAVELVSHLATAPTNSFAEFHHVGPIVLEADKALARTGAFAIEASPELERGEVTDKTALSGLFIG